MSDPEFLGALDAGADESTTPEPEPTEPAAEPAAEPEVVEKPAEPAKEPDKPAEKPRQDTVPHAALHEAREQNKQLRAKITELEGQPKLTTEDAALLRELREARKAQAEKEAEPDFLADPKGYVDTKVTTALKKLEKLEETGKKTEEQQTQQQQAQARYNQVVTGIAQGEAAFVPTVPDYTEAVTHARTTRQQQLQMLHPEATPEQITQHIAFEELTAAQQLLAAGKNPAEFAYNYAKTLGYQPKATPKPQEKPDKDAARTLGAGGGDAPEADDEGEDAMPEFTAALMERFKRKR